MTALNSASSRRWPARPVLLAWLAMTLLAVALSMAVGEGARRGLFDAAQKASPRDLSETDVRVVLIDDPSIAVAGRWPWSRYYLARLTEELAARGAKVIAFDMLFSERDPMGPDMFASLYPELPPAAAAEVKALQPMDELFGQVIGRAPVVLGHAGADKAPEGQPPLPDGVVAGTLPPRVDRWPAEAAAIPELDQVALGSGLMNGRPDGDGVIRRVPLVMEAGGKARPGFALEIARNRMGLDRVVASPTSVRIGGETVPIDSRGRMALHFGAFPKDKIISAGLVLASQVPADAVAGKTVLVGLSADGTSDIAATPLAAEEYGTLVQAQAVDALLRHGWLERPRWAGAAEWAGGAALALLALGLALFGKGWRWMLGAAFVAVPVACGFAFLWGSQLVDPARPMMVGGGGVAGALLGLFALARTDRARLREALVQERVAAAATEGELQAARAIQLAMVPRRVSLRGLDPRVDLDALLEPAKSVGGDFFDAMKLGADRIGFIIADVTGKGIPAALFMAMSKALASAALARTDDDLSTIAATINAELLKDNSEAMSVVMLIGILDLTSGRIDWICAGNEDPILIRPDGSRQRIRLEGGPPFCVADYPYPVERIDLEPGDTLLLFTDGVTEAQDPAGNLFGRDRIATGGDTAFRTSELVRERVRAFEAGEDATDDLTIMTIRYIGPSVP